ncbi:thioredoxin family protein [Chitinophaga caeni]|uniref:Thioredoxin family protein n=1 Tax=Chitinophaga caeni TaxID=2029983 RepID=A0A291QX03_9BACT|nr:thioredoxin family protein [Chitinophaga caeni]ATL48559.1 thioredoxin family protein [Chitinophaga caeni]
MEQGLPNVNKPMDYKTYREMMEVLVKAGRVSWDDSINYSPEYTKLNEQRMHRLDKTVHLISGLEEKLKNLDEQYTWVVITEPWCGDASQSVPVIQKAAEVNPNITIQYVMRDTHKDLMNEFLTNGSRSIPKLICYDTSNGKLKWHWGPRPAECQRLFLDMAKDDSIPFEEKAERLHKWYAQDKTMSLQNELLELVSTLS